MNGKGDTQRPAAITQREYADRYARTFTAKAPRERLDIADMSSPNDWSLSHKTSWFHTREGTQVLQWGTDGF